ncbi:uncharacterized protein BO80DRAFT_441094 [Aspergillus ibericus CBS 121593]|uniref:Uncharacterized protein n=1 Tax=Aspergillus ibericus CBS 121593 TaxID=1448316 RepID=A0A395HDG8_9EURO|nr:hypothetical protein BO80DRAFT_441094 [Aspergillus ibericus CBS 121593]RAL05513.1 hypothetical protein BO80DRAFT_441094 [Aspergillus ibericus CBS 121593]
MAPTTWFAQSQARPGTVVQLRSHAWVIREQINEYNCQLSFDDIPPGVSWPSYACARFLVDKQGARPAVRALMRIYIQVPLEGTEAEPPLIRAQQARSEFRPREQGALEQYHDSGITPRLLDKKLDRQEPWGVVPGGFLLRLVWEIVPGERLGLGYGESMFWGLPDEERVLIREKFRVGLMYVTPSRLLW